MKKIKADSMRIALTGTLALLVAVPLVLAAEQTRETYVAQVEPICKVNTEANEKILKGVRAEVRHGELKPAAVQVTKAAKALQKTLIQLRAVPQPSADKARLGKWLGYIKTEVGLFEKTAKKLRAGDTVGAERTSLYLSRESNRANNLVFSFEFHYCHAEPSKFL
jgi:hypothetical protein